MKVVNVRINGMKILWDLILKPYVYRGKFVRHQPEDSRM